MSDPFVVIMNNKISLNQINYACPNFRTTCAMALMFTLQHEFELSTLPSIPSNGHVGGLCLFLFYHNSQTTPQQQTSHMRSKRSVKVI